MGKTMLDKNTSDKLIRFYGGRNKAEAVLKSENAGVIVVCPYCSKVDINVVKHPDDCDPVFEQYRRESEDNQWK